eukprot:gene6258-6329_t
MKNTKKNAPIALPPSGGYEPPRTEGSLIIYTLGPKGGVGKTTVARLIVDGLGASGRDVTILQVDRAPTLPQLYKNVTTIEAPSAEEMRVDPHASIRCFEPLEDAALAGKDSGATVIVDIGAAQNQRAFIDLLARSRFDRHLTTLEINAIALVLVTEDQAAMQQSADLIDELIEVHPSAEIVPILNLRGGGFKFVKGTPAYSLYHDRIEPLVDRGRSVILPATADGSWQLFEAAGLTFTEAVMADEATLMQRLDLSRLMATALQGDVSEFLATVWPHLGAICGFSNIVSGKTARKMIGARLAEMSPAEMAKLPRATLMRFAPDALLSLARSSAQTDDILPVSGGAFTGERKYALNFALPLWAVSAINMAVVLAIVLTVATIERPARWMLVRFGVLTPIQAGLCDRLDHWTDQCAYEFRSSGTTFAEAANILAMPVEILAAENPDLPFGTPLPAHTILKINPASVALLAAIAAAWTLFEILPASFWSRFDDIALIGDIHAIERFSNEAARAASPPSLMFSDNEHMVQRFVRFFMQAGAWIAMPWNFTMVFWRLVVASDFAGQLSIRIVGVFGAALTAALPIYRQVLFSTPKVRSAKHVDGPNLYWFGVAVSKAREYLKRLTQEYPGGVMLAPGLALPGKAEYESFFAVGLPGAGKSVIIEGVTRQAIDRGDRVVLLDVKGELSNKINSFLGPRYCAALGMGSLCLVWQIGLDGQTDRAASRIAATLIPESRDPIWSAASRLVLKGLLRRLNRQHGKTWGWQHLQSEISRPIEEIAKRLWAVMPQVAEILRGRGEEPTSMSLSILFNMVAHISEIVDACAAMEAEGRRRISLTEWAQGRSRRRVIVLEHDLSNADNSELLLSVVLRILKSELLSSRVPDSVDHKIWLFADELPRFKSAAPEIAEIAALGRSRGIRVVGSAQSFAQIERALTRAGADALTENFGTVIICKARPGRNADELAKSFVGTAIYELASGADQNEKRFERLPALSPHQMSTCLGLRIDWRGEKFIRAAIIGLDNVYVAQWPLNAWPRL